MGMLGINSALAGAYQYAASKDVILTSEKGCYTDERKELPTLSGWFFRLCHSF